MSGSASTTKRAILSCRSYGKVALFKNQADGKLYAIKTMNRKLLQRKRIGPGELGPSRLLSLGRAKPLVGDRFAVRV